MNAFTLQAVERGRVDVGVSAISGRLRSPFVRQNEEHVGTLALAEYRRRRRDLRAGRREEASPIQGHQLQV